MHLTFYLALALQDSDIATLSSNSEVWNTIVDMDLYSMGNFSSHSNSNGSEDFDILFQDQKLDEAVLDFSNVDFDHLLLNTSHTVHGTQAAANSTIYTNTAIPLSYPMTSQDQGFPFTAYQPLHTSLQNPLSLSPTAKPIRIKLKLGLAQVINNTIYIRMPPTNEIDEDGLPLLLEQVSSLARLQAMIPTHLQETTRFYSLPLQCDYVAIGMPTVRNGVADENLRTIAVHDGQWELHVHALQHFLSSHGSAFVDCHCTICSRGVSVYLLYLDAVWLERLTPDRRYLATEPIYYLDEPTQMLTAYLRSRDRGWHQKLLSMRRRVRQTRARLGLDAGFGAHQPTSNLLLAEPVRYTANTDHTITTPTPQQQQQPNEQQVTTSTAQTHRQITRYNLNYTEPPTAHRRRHPPNLSTLTPTPTSQPTLTDYLLRATDRPANWPHSKTALESCLTCIRHGKRCHGTPLYGPPADRRCWNCSREPGSGNSRQCLWQDRGRGIVTFEQAYALLGAKRQRRIWANTRAGRAGRETERRVQLVRELGGVVDLERGEFELPPGTVVGLDGTARNGLRLELVRQFWVGEE